MGGCNVNALSVGVRGEAGVLTSPALFNFYINALIVELSSQPIGCQVDGVCKQSELCYDIVLLSASVCGLRVR